MQLGLSMNNADVHDTSPSYNQALITLKTALYLWNLRFLQ